MEIVKQNEQYLLSKVLENGWKVNGTATKHENGNLSFWAEFIVDDTTIGDFSYNSFKEGRIDMGCSTTESGRLEFINHMNQIIEEILKHFE